MSRVALARMFRKVRGARLLMDVILLSYLTLVICDMSIVENLVLSPMKLHNFTKITTGYTAGSGSLGVSTYDCWDESVPVTMTVMLDTTGDLQTVVGSLTSLRSARSFS